MRIQQLSGSRRPFFLYFEERTLGGATTVRRRNVHVKVPRGTADLSMSYGFHRTHKLENRENAPIGEGVWPLNGLRVDRYWGYPTETECPSGSDPSFWRSDVDDCAKRNRLHHYSLIRDLESARRAVVRNNPISVAIEVTSDWSRPELGYIPHPYQDLDVSAIHAIPLVDYDYETQSFLFLNSWGPEWGDDGKGYLHESLYDHVQFASTPYGLGVQTAP